MFHSTIQISSGCSCNISPIITPQLRSIIDTILQPFRADAIDISASEVGQMDPAQPVPELQRGPAKLYPFASARIACCNFRILYALFAHLWRKVHQAGRANRP